MTDIGQCPSSDRLNLFHDMPIDGWINIVRPYGTLPYYIATQRSRG
ncbi:hypothetical protein [Algoriphagus persicinus]|nr:hypothetical protein [Algoriphagus sp. E1-3-M2]MEB2786896.1 hypothetical protein [Algoriphagus sp. E1-3-M2]MEB2786897.1 hypothetical protein [Algoriphagus sp. E1-3-M2]MEB2786898.1 hypothetical protein [Algoriphagus sp. E1-3-M2]